jgi:P-type Ca2+ transporter type 2C
MSRGFIINVVILMCRWGKIKSKLSTESEPTPLQEKLTTLADQIGYGGMGAAVATFGAMMAIYFFIPENRDPDMTLFEVMLKSFIMAVTIVVVAVPEGLPLAVTLSLAFSTQKMMDDNNLIRVLAACETMGNATNICSDKTGTLTQNKMTVVEAWIGGNYFDTAPTADDIAEVVVDLLADGISVNTTAILVEGESGAEVVGNKTEGALLMFLKKQLGRDYAEVREIGFSSERGDKLITFSSQRKCMSVVQNYPSVHRVLCKGAAEVLLAKCVSYITPTGAAKKLTKKVIAEIDDVIADMAKNALRVVALAHREVSSRGDEPSGNLSEQYENNLVLDAIFGIKDPLRPDVTNAVRTCQEAGIFVRMVTGDNIETAKAIAIECGILTPGGIAMEGPEFRKLTPAQLDAILPTLQVLARSSPNDKYVLVTRLNGHNLPTNAEEWNEAHPGYSYERDRNFLLPGYEEEWKASKGPSGVGEVVGVTGDGTNGEFSYYKFY